MSSNILLLLTKIKDFIVLVLVIFIIMVFHLESFDVDVNGSNSYCDNTNIFLENIIVREYLFYKIGKRSEVISQN